MPALARMTIPFGASVLHTPLLVLLHLLLPSAGLTVPLEDTEQFAIKPAVSSDAQQFPFRPIYFDAVRTPRAARSMLAVTDEMDVAYMTTVNFGGTNFSLQLDTGSSDLWVHSATRINTMRSTGTPVSLAYGSGSATGTVDYAAFSIGDYTIPEQAFVNADKVEHEQLSGIFPLGLDALSVVHGTFADKSATVKSPLTALFSQQPTKKHNFIGLALERSANMENVAGGILSIGAYDPRFPLISRSQPIPLASPPRWTIPLSGLSVNGRAVPLPSAKRVALIDSGTTFASLPAPLVDAIYGAIPGARYLSKSNTWAVPCLSAAKVAFAFGEDEFAVHPLDLTTVTTTTTAGKDGGVAHTLCVNAFQASSGDLSGDFDMILGDAFMRNVYAVFNFGNATEGGFEGVPSIQMVGRTDGEDLMDAFLAARDATLATMPPLIDPMDVLDA
ncbi:hypothetical protein PLICRDRAFT_243487 [Plicaturopsis crispa FD-325 SS-3]|nr:hypothetical protein PLICRDRAFT_243487 [Plicaturopsis crispa FD-325 SS-3]